MTTHTPILTLEELDEIERYARLYDDVFYGFLPAHPSGRWDAYLPEYREKAICAMTAVFERRALLQRREAAGVKDTSLNAEEQALDDALARLLKPWPADIINDENIGPITMRQAVLIRRSIRNAAKQRFWNEFYIKEVLSQRQEPGEAKPAKIPPMTQDEFQTCFDLSNSLNRRTHFQPGAISVGECFNLLREAGVLSAAPPNKEGMDENDRLLMMEMNYEGALSDCRAAVTVLIRRINGEADLASAAEWIRLNYPKRAAELAKPVKMLVDQEWLRQKTEADPSLDCEVFTPTNPPSREEIAKEIASFACRRHLINSNAYEALADRIFALINGASE